CYTICDEFFAAPSELPPFLQLEKFFSKPPYREFGVCGSKKGDQFVLRESVTELFSGDDFGVDGDGSEASSLVFSSDNSAKSPLNCEKWILIEGCCEHDNKRFRIVPCGRRACAYCGPIGRWRIAERIAFGVRQFWPAAWLVLTWATPEAEESAFKKKAVRQVNEFLRKLFRERGVNRLPVAKTWELTGR